MRRVAVAVIPRPAAATAMWYLKVLFDKADGGIDDAECEEITEWEKICVNAN